MNRVKQAVAQWRRELPELDVLPMEVVGSLVHAARLIVRTHLEPFFQSHGLQQGEFDVLATLRRAGAPYALSPTDLFESLMISSGGMTNRLDRLEQAGLIARSRNPEDRRGTIVSLTERGLELMNRIIPLHVENQARAIAALSRKEQKQLRDLLSKLIPG
jgi:DNA-binding MarR family transcriptional regulator